MSLAVVFGTNLRNYRKAKGLTQAELAERASLSTEMISKIERGVASPSFLTIEKLAEILDVPEFQFFGIGLVGLVGGDRSRIISKINTRLSRLSEEQLARINRLISAAFD